MTIKNMTIKGLPVYYYKETESTNDAVKEFVPPCVAVAGIQTKGRGRGTRQFMSGAGGLYFSYMFVPKLPIEKGGLYSIAAGVAVCGYTGGGIKWPNDVYINGKKAAGILCERYVANGGERMIIGVGVNINNDDIDTLPGATSLKREYNKEFDIKEALSGICGNLIDITGSLENGLDITAEFKRHDILKDKEAVIVAGDRRYTAVCAGIDGNGLLIINKDGRTEKIASADVSILIQ